MYGTARTAKRLLRFGTACLLAVLACAASVAMAVEMTPRMLVPVGHTVGIKLFSKGVVVVKLTDGGTPARACGLRTGDVIVQCGGDAVTSSEQFQSLLQTCGGTAELEVRRNGDSMTLSVEPERNDRGVYCIGAWIRDSMAGIGTMTYYDPATATFGALGHGITDVDTAQLMPFSNGSILPSTVKPGAIAFSNRRRRILLLFFGQRLQRLIKFSSCVCPAPNHPDILRHPVVALVAVRMEPAGRAERLRSVPLHAA